MDFCRPKLCKIYVQIDNLKNGPLSHLNGFHVFPRDNIRKTFTVMHYPIFEHEDTLSIAFLVFIILYIGGKEFRCSVFTFVQYINVQSSCNFKNNYTYGL